VEILLLRQKSGMIFEALIRPGRVKVNEKIMLDTGKVSAILTARNEITFEAKNTEAIYGLGPCLYPLYKERGRRRRQCLLSDGICQRKGSIAAPTAGLHFTKELIDKIKARGTGIIQVTLHISYSTFKPVKTEDIANHRMEKEYFQITPQARQALEEARLKGIEFLPSVPLLPHT